MHPGSIYIPGVPTISTAEEDSTHGVLAVDFQTHLKSAWELTLEFIAPLIIMTLVMLLLWIVSLGVLIPVTLAGYTQSLLRMLREGRDPVVKDLFSEMPLFLPLMAFGLLVLAVAAAGLIFLVLPGLVVSFLVACLCLYVVPLMTDRRLGLFAAIKKSVAMVRQGNLVDHLVVVIIFLGITAIGSSVFIGSLFTQPLATLFLVSVYNEKIQSA